MFSTGTTISQDNANFFWNNTTKSLGIGNNAPTTTLDVTGVIKGSSDANINGMTVGRGGGNINGNTAIGLSALLSNTTSSNNTAIGFSALRLGTTGGDNVAIGVEALRNGTTSGGNTAIGRDALRENNGNGNIGIGNSSLLYGGTNTIGIGVSAGNLTQQIDEDDNPINNTGAINGIYIGIDTKALNVNQTNEIIIGNNALGLGSNTTVIGNSSTTTTAIRGGSLLLGTTTDVPTSILTLNSISKGFLPPRMSTTDRGNIASPATGLQIYIIMVLVG